MRVEIYYDVQFLIVFVTLFCTVFLANLVLERTVTAFQIAPGAAFGAAAYVAVTFLPLRSFLKEGCWFFGISLTVCLSFSIRRFRSILKVLKTYWVCSMAWGGLVALTYRIILKVWGLSDGALLLLEIEILVTLFGYVILRCAEEKMGRREGWASAELQGEKLQVQAFVDTGNSLYEPISGKPVCVLRAPAKELQWTDGMLFRVVPYKTVDVPKGILQAYRIPKLYLDLGGPVKCVENVFVAAVITDKEEAFAELIVHPKILSEKTMGKEKRKGRERDHAANATVWTGTTFQMARTENAKNTGGRFVLRWRNRRVAASAGTGEGESNDRSTGDGRGEGGQGHADRT